MTPLEALEAIKLLLAAYPTQRLRMSAEDVRGMNAAYTAALSDLPFEVVRVGITKLVKTSKWMPTIAEIRGAAVIARDGRAQEGAEGWGDVLAAVGRFGVNREPGKDFEFADKLVDRVVHAIGWRELCLSTFQIADRARFIELYEQLAEHDAVDRISGMAPTSQRILAGGVRALTPSPERTLEPAHAKLELVAAEDDEPQGDMIKRLAAEVVDKLEVKPR